MKLQWLNLEVEAAVDDDGDEMKMDKEVTHMCWVD